MTAAGSAVAAAGPPDVVVAAGSDVAVAVAAAAGPDAAAAGAVPLPIVRKITRNALGQCVEETYYMLGKHGHRAAKPH